MCILKVFFLSGSQIFHEFCRKDCHKFIVSTPENAHVQGVFVCQMPGSSASAQGRDMIDREDVRNHPFFLVSFPPFLKLVWNSTCQNEMIYINEILFLEYTNIHHFHCKKIKFSDGAFRHWCHDLSSIFLKTNSDSWFWPFKFLFQNLRCWQL